MDSKCTHQWCHHAILHAIQSAALLGTVLAWNAAACVMRRCKNINSYNVVLIAPTKPYPHTLQQQSNNTNMSVYMTGGCAC